MRCSLHASISGSGAGPGAGSQVIKANLKQPIDTHHTTSLAHCSMGSASVPQVYSTRKLQLAFYTCFPHQGASQDASSSMAAKRRPRNSVSPLKSVMIAQGAVSTLQRMSRGGEDGDRSSRRTTPLYAEDGMGEPVSRVYAGVVVCVCGCVCVRGWGNHRVWVGGRGMHRTSVCW